ncbi:MAG: N-acetylmuramic acid 6-phosphate etherase [Pedobacter sp.]|jgi:N-acetylmuramic acid 6-phosphate etherase
MKRTTEEDSNYTDLDRMSVAELLHAMNNEDKTVPIAVGKVIPAIEKVVNVIVEKIKAGGRLFYIGAGTSGRLGILDASECPPTYGVPFDMVVGIIAGGDRAIRRAVENAEDNTEQAWKDLLEFNISDKDVLIGIAASGSTPYVIGGLRQANENGVITACIVCNSGSAVAAEAKLPIEVIVGPEFVTGSTRMKSGTAQKLVLNMISTSTMIRLGRIKGNKMVDMQLTNIKLVGRALNMVMQATKLDAETAQQLLNKYGSVRKAVENAPVNN